MLPLWSAAVDPRVLSVRALPAGDLQLHPFDARSPGARIVRGARGEHLLVDRGGEPIRLDVVAGTTVAGPVGLRFDLADDDHLEARVATIRALRGPTTTRGHVQIAGRLLALQAVDAREAGSSLREVADRGSARAMGSIGSRWSDA